MKIESVCIITLLFLLMSCSDSPEGVATYNIAFGHLDTTGGAFYTGSYPLTYYPGVWNPANEGVTDKDKLLFYLEYGDSIHEAEGGIPFYYQYSSTYRFETSKSDAVESLDSLVVFIENNYNDETALSAEMFPNGFPLTMYRTAETDSSYEYMSQQFENSARVRGKPIILLNGYSSFADTAYNGYALLPIRNDSTEYDYDTHRNWRWTTLFPFTLR